MDTLEMIGAGLIITAVACWMLLRRWADDQERAEQFRELKEAGLLQ